MLDNFPMRVFRAVAHHLNGSALLKRCSSHSLLDSAVAMNGSA